MRRFRFRFTLPQLFALTAIVAAVLAYRANTVPFRIERQELEYLRLRRALVAGGVETDYPRSFLVPDFITRRFRRVTALELRHETPFGLCDEDLGHLRCFARLQRLSITSTDVTNDGLRWIREIPNLRSLTLRDTAVNRHALGDLAPITRIETSSSVETNRAEGF